MNFTTDIEAMLEGAAGPSPSAHPQSGFLAALDVFSSEPESLRTFMFHRPMRLKNEIVTGRRLSGATVDLLIDVLWRLFNDPALWVTEAGPFICRYYRAQFEELCAIRNRNVTLANIINPQSAAKRALFLLDDRSAPCSDSNRTLWALMTLQDHRNYRADVLKLKYVALESLIALTNDHSLLDRLKPIGLNTRLILSLLNDLQISLTHLEGQRAGLGAFQDGLATVRRRLTQSLTTVINELQPPSGLPSFGGRDMTKVAVYIEKSHLADSGLATCFFPMLRGLKDYDVTILSADIPEGLEGLKHHLVGSSDPQDLIAMIEKLSAGIVINYGPYMTYRSSVLSVQRQAPIHLTLPGYPIVTDTGNTDGIVYTAGELSENLPVVGPMRAGGMRFSSLKSVDIPQYKGVTPDGDRPCVGISANAYKLTSPYIASLREARKAVDMSFHLLGKNKWTERHVLTAQLPDMTVHKPTELADYLDRVARTHFLIAAYPFGNLVNIIHALQIGVPTLVLKGSHPNSRAGAAVLESIGLDDFVVHDPDEYQARLVEQARSANVIVSRRDQIIKDVQSLLCEEDHSLNDLLHRMVAAR